jgi:hypothetical protein
MAKDDPYFRLRVPENLKAQIEKSAAESNRSMTAEIISRLERSYDVDDRLSDAPEWLADHEKRIDQLESIVQRLEEATFPGRYDRD